MLASPVSKSMSSVGDLNEFPSDDSSDDNNIPTQVTKKRGHRFSDSENENEKENLQNNDIKTQDNNSSDSSSSEAVRNIIPSKSRLLKSRIRFGGEGDSSDSDVNECLGSMKNEEQQMRMKNKRSKLKDKFKDLLNSRDKQTAENIVNKQSSEDSATDAVDESNSEMSSIAKIKQKIKKSMATMSSICDPDTSDEENSMSNKQNHKQKPKKQKPAKLIEPKPQRMSAKQAMENMQLIKSESNRMLREKSVSLPYHRPKALLLKDIMARRKPALTSDGKAFPIKMNEDQLKQYVLLLEQRQKEMMELCKSESDEETADNDERCDETQPETDSNNIECNIEQSKNTTECLENETVHDNIDTPANEVNNVNEVNDESPNKELKTSIPEPEVTNDENTENIDDASYLGPKNQTEEQEQNDSYTDFKLVYNDSMEEDAKKNHTVDSTLKENEQAIPENSEQAESNLENNHKLNSEPESQFISLHFTENNTEELGTEKPVDTIDENSEKMDEEADNQEDLFSDDDINMEDIDKIIENAEIMKDEENVTMNSNGLNAKPKLIGTPGMLIDLDGGADMPKKLSGVELLKERFAYFSKLKTPEELERDKEKTLKPGAQHLKLKQELEEQIAEQRSLEWAKRLEEEKQQHKEMESILDDAEDSFEKAEDIENEDKEEISSSESEEEELEENDIELKDKPRKHNPMLDEEADESDFDRDDRRADNEEINDDANEENDIENVDDDGDSSDEESSESEEETTKPKKGRILKAFEDSDDEDVKQEETKNADDKIDSNEDAAIVAHEIPSASQDDVLHLAQRHISASDDLFTSQESSSLNDKNKERISAGDDVLGTQTFSILDSTAGLNMDMAFKSPSKLNDLCMSQPYHDPNLNAIVDGSQFPITQSSQSQPLGEDILALCTGKFYDNEFISPTHESQLVDTISQEPAIDNDFIVSQEETATINNFVNQDHNSQSKDKNLDNVEVRISENYNANVKEDGVLLKSILDELHAPEFDKPKQNKFFNGGTQQKTEDLPQSSQMKKRLVIDSDDENTNDNNTEIGEKKRKKLKKKRAEKRALQISDDEEEDDDEYISDIEDDDEDNERLVEYDSEENEIEVQPDKPKKKRKVDDFFEQEAELTSEDEWVGSGDEDEKDLDKMEREAGDDEVFHQGKLRRELGQIHMRDVLDQDKREVRIIQELLFEDGDLGDGHRQRKFRWKNAGDDDTETMVDRLADTQEEEFESEEQWRKQRHEREVFLKQMQQKEEAETSLNVSVNRTTIIKANLLSKSMSTLLEEVNQTNVEKTESPVVQEKKTTKDIPSPKKSFTIFQQNYHGSLLTRGRGALARLAALATPLAADDDSPKTSNLAPHKGNFVFATLTPKGKEPKVTIKRKAEANQGTPKLVKKMKIEEKQIRLKSSLLDHINL